jgi:type I restriction enzyme M protein
LEGLEVTELNLSEVRRENIKLRLDSGYFSKAMLEAEALIRKQQNGYEELGSLFSRFVKGIFDINAESYCESGVPFLRILNLRKGIIDDNNLALIPENVHTTEIKTELKLGDIVLSKTAYPAASLVTLNRCNTSQDTIATTLSKYGKNAYTPETIVAYLNCKIGQRLLWRQFQGNVQLHLSLDDGRKVPIPKFCIKLQSAITQAFRESISTKNRSKSTYTQAETLLLDTLDLANFSPSTEAVNLKSFKDSFAATGRLDAEYYQPKFDELEAKIAETHELCPLGRLLTLNQRGTQPNYAEEGLPVINSKHVREGEVILSDNRVANLPDKENSLYIQKDDVLINGTGVGTIGRSAPYLHEQNAIPDNHVTILRTDKLNPIFLSVYLNSIAGKYQVDKYFKGSSGQIELYPKDIDCFYVPLVNEAIQTEIAALVQQSFTLKTESERLLDVAKSAVEIAIEQDEPAALAYIEAHS